MAEEMHERDPSMRYDSLRIIGDEIWNFADGSRRLNPNPPKDGLGASP